MGRPISSSRHHDHPPHPLCPSVASPTAAPCPAGRIPASKGRNPAPTGAHHDRSANALRQPATRGSAPCTNNWCVPCARPSWRATCPCTAACPPAVSWPGISDLPQHGGTGLWPARGGGVSGAQGGRRQLCRPGGGAPAPRPPQSAAGLSRRGQEMALGGACHDVPEVGTTFASSQPDPRLFPRHSGVG